MVDVGDIFVATWGYDQTNADFFQVVKVTGKSIKVRHIKSKEKIPTGEMTGYAVPIKNAFDGSEKTKRLSEWDGKEVFRAGESYGLAEKWNGNEVSISTYA